MLGLTIKKMIEDALPFVGLPKSPIQNDVLEVALGIINFEGQMIFDRWPFDAEKNITYELADSEGVVTFDSSIDVIRAIRVLTEPINTEINSTDVIVSGGSEADGAYIRNSLLVNGKYEYVCFGYNMFWTPSGDGGAWLICKNGYPIEFLYNIQTGPNSEVSINAPLNTWDANLSITEPQQVVSSASVSYDLSDSIPLLSEDEVTAWLKDVNALSSGTYQYMSNDDNGNRRIKVDIQYANTYIAVLALTHFSPFSETDIDTRKFPIDRAEAALKGELIDGLREFMGMELTNKGSKAFGIAVNREEKQQQKPMRIVPRHPIFSDED